MSQSIHNLKESLDQKILREFHFNPPTINEEVQQLKSNMHIELLLMKKYKENFRNLQIKQKFLFKIILNKKILFFVLE